jgi:hypothetical protein
MNPPAPVSGKAVASFAAALLFLAFGVLAFAERSDLLALAALVCWTHAVLLGVLARREITASAGTRGGRPLAGWGIHLSAWGLVGGVLLLSVYIRSVMALMYDPAHKNARSISLGFWNYATDNGGRLPPAASRDRDGRPLLSWRVLLLPYIDEGELYRQFNLNEPWDGPTNKPLLARMPDVYRPAPLEGVEEVPHTTHWQVFVGPGTAFEGAEGLRVLADFPDGLANTIFIAEATEAVPWTKPADLDYAPGRPVPPLGRVCRAAWPPVFFRPAPAPAQFLVALGDSSVRSLRQPPLSEETLRRAITRNDGQPLGPDW